MTSLKHLPILFSFSCLSFQLAAQSHDPDGYYIDRKGDTVNGRFSKYAEYRNSPVEVPFLTAGTGNLVLLTPDNCLGFSVAHSDTYLSFKGKRMTNPTNYHNATSQSTDTYEEVSAFIREIYNDGSYRLYEFRSTDRSNFYVSSNSSPMSELYFREYLADDNGTGADNVVESAKFRQQLGDFFKQILQTNPGLWTRIGDTKYTSESLKDLFYAMTKRHEPKVKGKYPAQVFIGLGASSNGLTVSAESMFVDPGIDEKVTSGNYSSQTTPVIEAGIKLFSQRNHGRLFLTIRANYYTFQNSSPGFADPYNYMTYSTTFKGSILSFPVGIGYKLVSAPNFGFEVSAGAAFVGLLQNTQTQYATNGVTVTSTTEDNNKSISFSFFGEAAIQVFKRFSVFAAYYSPCQIASYQEYNPVHTSMKYGLRCYLF